MKRNNMNKYESYDTFIYVLGNSRFISKRVIDTRRLILCMRFEFFTEMKLISLISKLVDFVYIKEETGGRLVRTLNCEINY